MPAAPRTIKSSSIDSLPDELLEEIFLCLVDQGEDSEYSEYMPHSFYYGELDDTPKLRDAVYHLPDVCPRWKNILERSGRCWVMTLTFTYEAESRSPNLLESLEHQCNRWLNALEAATNCDLVVRVRVRPESPSLLVDSFPQKIDILGRCLVSLQRHRHQLHDIQFTFEECVLLILWTPICYILAKPLPRLTKLHVKGTQGLEIKLVGVPRLPEVENWVLELPHARALTWLYIMLPRFCSVA
jgi:hypothetical protein